MGDIQLKCRGFDILCRVLKGMWMGWRWDGDGAEVVSVDVPTLKGVLGADGSEDWWTAMDVVDSELFSGTQRITFERGGVVQHESLAELRVLSDGESLWLTIPLPPKIDLDRVTIRRHTATSSHPVVLLPEKRLHLLQLERRRFRR